MRPQYEIVFSESYITEEEANARLVSTSEPWAHQHVDEVSNSGSELSAFSPNAGQDGVPDEAESATPTIREYERMMLHSRPHLCAIPHVEPVVKNNYTRETTSKEDQEKELARAADRGWELLQDMQKKACLFYSTGWWSYSFCHNSEVRQFHALPPGANGAPIHPPTEDPNTPSYVLGKFEVKAGDQYGDRKPSVPSTELQTKAETSYLVQKLDGGTACDLTGKARKIEVQYHCHPQSSDRVGWIKETATCTYLMVIYTPRLCNDIAFLPPRESKSHPIICEEILTPYEVLDWEVRLSAKTGPMVVAQGNEQAGNPPIVIGDIEVGAMKAVGRDGPQISRGRVASTREELAETIAIQKDGKVEGLSKADLRKKNINPETVEAFRKEIQKKAGAKDWKVQIIDGPHGGELQGIIGADDEEAEGTTKAGGKGAEGEKADEAQGSEEEYKEDI